ncbi:hypothetical protein GGS23DRAFT_595932 [Durotheca rogersii]|uniref:uncharacterized protein n=1 Tax=Durotheca rogersii TaxID=419775 RepID=UPI00221E6209|nr:uncharacterized protein GGS23DRAFT_595932 [Durotheca rogersii]KAI5864299.1 hypothetical protein GGS23DRAFT_595932 [Durotheca rogersii]
MTWVAHSAAKIRSTGLLKMASSVQLYPRKTEAGTAISNPLPPLIQTPSGLAILELQGSINLPHAGEGGEDAGPQEISVGRLVFPDYHPETQDPSSTSWMKRVHLYVGEHQRLTGEVKKLPKAIAIIKKQVRPGEDVEMADGKSEPTAADLEVVEIVKYKLVFSQRPEPVGTG